MLNLLQVEFHHKNAWSTYHYVCTVLKPRFKVHHMAKLSSGWCSYTLQKMLLNYPLIVLKFY